MRRAFSPRRSRPPSGCRAAGETRIGLVFVAGEERGSDGAKAANRIASKTRFLINGEPTDLRLGSATRGVFSRAPDRAGQGGAFRLPGARRIGDRKADRLPDGAARRRLAVGPAARHDALHGRFDQRRRGAERDPAERRSGSVLPDRRRSRAASRAAAPDAGRPRRRCRRSSSCRRRACTPCPDSRPRCSRTSATSRSCRIGERRCCSGRARSTSRIPIASTLAIGELEPRRRCLRAAGGGAAGFGVVALGRSRSARARRPAAASNCAVGIPRATLVIATWTGRAARYGRSFVIASNASATATIRPAIGMSCPSARADSRCRPIARDATSATFRPAAAAAPGCRRGCARRSTVWVRITRYFAVGQRPGLAQQRIGNADLADVVQRRGAPQQAGVFGGPADRLGQPGRQQTRRAGCARWSLRRDTRRRARGARSSRCASIRARACWPVADSSSVRFCFADPGTASALSSRLRTRSSTSTVSNGLVTKSLAPRVSACWRASSERSPVTTSTGSRSWLMSGVSDVEHAEAVDLRHVQIGDHQVGRRARRAAPAARASSVSPVTV